jgi:hypothetical protein
MGLTDLPDELLLHIIGYVPHNRKTLAAICLGSRKINGAATECLYSKVDSLHSCHQLQLLVRTLHERPNLAQKVKRMYLFVGTHNSSSPWADGINENKLIATSLSHLADKHIPLQALGHLASGISKRYATALTSLLFLMLPKLEIPRFTDDSMDRTVSHLVRLFYGAEPEALDNAMKVEGFEDTGLRKSLDSVQNLTIGVQNSEILTFFDLPCLESLSIDMTDTAGRNLNDHELQTMFGPLRSSQGLRSLVVRSDFTSCVAHATNQPVITSLLSALTADRSQIIETQALEKFDFLLQAHIGTFYHSHHNTPGSFQFLLDSLWPIASSLTHLSIGFASIASLVSEERRPSIREFASMDRLSHFTRLRKLEVLQEAIVDAGYRCEPHPQTDFLLMLPTTLEELVILSPDGMVVPWLRDLCAVVGEFPNLRNIQLKCRWDYGRPASYFLKKHSGVFDLFHDYYVSIDVYDTPQLNYGRPRFGNRRVQLRENDVWDEYWYDPQPRDAVHDMQGRTRIFESGHSRWRKGSPRRQASCYDLALCMPLQYCTQYLRRFFRE